MFHKSFHCKRYTILLIDTQYFPNQTKSKRKCSKIHSNYDFKDVSFQRKRFWQNTLYIYIFPPLILPFLRPLLHAFTLSLHFLSPTFLSLSLSLCLSIPCPIARRIPESFNSRAIYPRADIGSADTATETTESDHADLPSLCNTLLSERTTVGLWLLSFGTLAGWLLRGLSRFTSPGKIARRVTRRWVKLFVPRLLFILDLCTYFVIFMGNVIRTYTVNFYYYFMDILILLKALSLVGNMLFVFRLVYIY